MLRLLLRIVKIVGSVLLLVCALAALAYMIVTKLPGPRDKLAAFGIDVLRREADVYLEVGHIERLDPFQAELRNVRVAIPEIGLVAKARRVRVGFRPWALFSREVHFTSAWVSGAEAVFEPPVEDADEADQEEESAQTPAWRVEINRIALHDARVTWHGLPDYSILVSEVNGGFTYEQAPAIRVSRGELDLFEAGALRAHVARVHGSYEPEQGGNAFVTGDVASAPFEIALTLPDAASIALPIPFDSITAQVKGLSRESLVALGGEAVSGLRDPLDMRLDFEHKQDRFYVDLGLEAKGAELRATGFVSTTFERAELALDFRAPLLSRLHPDLPQERASGQLQAQIQRAGRQAHVLLSFRELRLGQASRVLSGDARASLTGSELRLERLTLREAGGGLEASGRYHLESGVGTARLRATAFSLGPVCALLGLPVQGVLTGTAELSQNVLGMPAVRATGLFGALQVADVVQVQRLSFDVHSTSTRKRPELQATLKAESLRVQGVRLPGASMRAVLDGDDLAVRFTAASDDTDLRGALIGRVAQNDPLEDMEGSLQVRGRLLGQRLSLNVERLARARGSLHLTGLSVRLEDAVLRGQGELSASGELQAGLEVRALPIALLARSLKQSDHARFRGALSLSLRLAGTLVRPMATVAIEMNDVSFGSMPPLRGHAAALIDAGHGRATLQLAVQGGTGTFLEARSEVLWPQGTALADLDSLAYGRNYLNLSLPYADLPRDVALPELDDVWLSAKLNLEGKVSALSGQILVSARKTEDAVAPLELEAILQPGQVSLRFDAVDGPRKTAQLSGSAEVGLSRAGFAGLTTGRFEPDSLRAEVHYRFEPLQRVEGVLGQLVHAYQLDVPVGASGNAHLALQGNSLEGSLYSTFDIRSAALDTACAAEEGALGRLEAQLAADQIRATVALEGHRGGNAYAQLSMPLRGLMQGLKGGLKGDLLLDARGENLPLSSLPYLCALDAGHAGFALRARVVNGKAPETRLKLRVEGLSSARATAVSSQLSVRTDGRSLELDAVVHSQGRERAQVGLSLPLRYRGLTPGLALNEPVHGNVRLHELPVGPILQFTEGIGGASGTLSGDVELSGTLKDPRPQGFLAFDAVSFVVASLAQPIRDLSGRIDLHGDRVTFRDLEAYDRNGKLSLTGKADLRREGYATAEFKLKTEQLPVRRQGKVMGRLSLGADVQAKIDRHGKLTVDAGIRYGTLQFLGTTGKAVQDLDPHPDVHLKRDEHEDKKDLGSRAIVLRSLELSSKQDLWIRHRDFSVQLGINLSIVPKGERQVLVGEARIARGNLKLLGKSFTIQRGAVRFTEDSDEPELDLRASFDPPAGGLPLSVQISGRASHPVLAFSGAADNADKAFAILSGMNSAAAAASAQADVNSFGLGLTAGLVSMTARQELGAWVPTLSVGSNSRGEASQARAGFDASQLIPPALRRFARGAYVEGIVGETREGPGGSVGLGVRFELSLPRSVVTTVTYGPGTNWSADVAWVP